MLLSQVFEAFERERFVCPKLVELRDRLKREGTAPSVAIAKLNRLSSPSNPVITSSFGLSIP